MLNKKMKKVLSEETELGNGKNKIEYDKECERGKKGKLSKK